MLLILSAFRGVWEWLTSGGAASIGTVILWVFLALLALVSLMIIAGALYNIHYNIKKRWLASRAGTSAVAEQRYKEFLQREAESAAKEAEEKAKKEEESIRLAEERRVADRWKTNPTSDLISKLGKSGKPCTYLSLLEGREAFVALRYPSDAIVLGTVTRQGEITSTETIPASKIVAIDTGNNVDVTSETHGGGGIVSFGGLGLGSMNTTTNVDAHVRSSYIVLTVDYMSNPIRSIVFTNQDDCVTWVGRIQLLMHQQGK